MFSSTSLALRKSPFSAVVSASLISSGFATDASECTVSGVISCVIAAQLCSMFATLLQSPFATFTSASFASFVMFIFSPATMWSISFSMCCASRFLNLNTAHLLCIGSIILLL